MKDLLFIHIPKNAGNNIKNRLKHLNFLNWGHKPISGISDAVRKSKYTFAVVRNPWERELSLHAFFSPNFSFMQYLRECVTSRSAHFRNTWERGRSLQPVMTLHQCDYICVDGKIAVDRILRFEHLQSDLNQMLEELNYPPIKLTHTHRGHYDKAELTSEARDIISRIRKKDIEMFDYA